MLDITLPKVSEEKIRDELAKQLSAFANTGGGRVIYGLTDTGKVELGGVTRVAKGRRSTKEWIEDLVPSLTDYEILGVNVYEITGKRSKSQIQSGKALYVVDVPDSDRAPHQSRRDQRYYVRVGSKSQPAPHRLIEDIRNRVRHPNVTVTGVEIKSIQIPRQALPKVRGPMQIYIEMTIKNTGRIKATNACMLVEPHYGSCSISASKFDEYINARVGPIGNDTYLEIRHPIYPEMSTPIRYFVNLSVELHSFIASVESTWFLLGPQSRVDVDDVMFSWTIYADSAPPRTGRIVLGELRFSREAIAVLERDAAWQEISNCYYEQSKP